MTAFLLLIALAVPQEAPSPDGAAAASQVADDGLLRDVRFTQEVWCASDGGKGHLEEVRITVAVPVNNERQQVSGLVFEPTPARVHRDRWGNTVAEFRRPRLNAGQAMRVGWRCRALTRTIAHDVVPDGSSSLEEIPKPIRQRYLGGGEKYGLDSEKLRRAAAVASAGASDAKDLAFRLNEFVRKHLRYVNDGRWDDAPVVLANGHGSCSEYNFLFMALCRLNGLPARYVGATALRNDHEIYEDTVHHRWTEVYLPGHGWFPVDVSRNDGEDGAPINQSFGRTDRALLVLMKGDGDDDDPLQWGYVAAVKARRHGDARVRRPKRFVWTRSAVTGGDETGQKN